MDQVRDNLDLERWFRLLKGHQRRIHGHKHAGVRIVQEGPTKALALDAHRAHRGLFTVDDLLPYRSARVPECQCQAMSGANHEKSPIQKAAVCPDANVSESGEKEKPRKAIEWNADMSCLPYL